MLDYGYTCPLMYQDEVNCDFLSPHRFWVQNENCQNLNIWTPSLEPDKHLPVVVWLHGGGFFAGSSIEQYAYDGRNMSYYGNVVTVTLNHRLNVLGYMDLRGFGEKYERSGNVGNLDIIAALKWIRKNIQMFGGDPENVTIFGQSGGGGKVITLMQMPQADGLFHKAMIMSGILGEFLTDPGIDMRPVIQYMLTDLEISEDIDQLQTIPYKTLVRSYLRACKTVLKTKGVPYFGPVKNQDYFGDPMKVGFTENAKKIPVIIGSTISEFFHSPYKDIPDKEMAEIFVQKYGVDTAEKLKELFWKTYPEKRLSQLYDIDASAFRYWTKKWIERRCIEGAHPTYSYLFTLNFDFNGGTSAWHCADIPFFFHNIDKVPIANMDNISEVLQDQIFGAFMNFVYTGKPYSNLLPSWPACGIGDETVMIFDRQCQVKHNFDTELIDILYSLNIQNLDFLSEGDL